MVVVLMLLLLSFDVCVSTSDMHLLLFLDKCFVRMYINVNYSFMITAFVHSFK